MNSKITAHMIIKNEDQWVWFAIQSVLPYVDQFLITDTGSTDNTIQMIKSIDSQKIIFNEDIINNKRDITKVRQKQIEKTISGWIWLVDGDEIYTEKSAFEILDILKKDKHFGIIAKRHDLLGDVYHNQDNCVGSYQLYGESGHFSTRLVNSSKINGLVFKGDYPLEGYFDKNGKSLKKYDKKNFYFTNNEYWHSSYLKRSSLGSNINSMFNRNKYKIETGNKISDPLPEVFYQKRPNLVPDPLKKRGLKYEILASLITPLKKLKRKLV